jgi:anti-anti-sigma factor
MEIQVTEAEPATIVAITGSVDGLTAGPLMERLSEEVKSGKTRLVLDFSGVDYVSSAGLRALLATMKDARQKSGDVRLAGVRPEVSRVLELSGFTSILKLFPDTAAAAASFAK